MPRPNELLSAQSLLIITLFVAASAIPDFSLVCRRGYRLTAIHRTNSHYQKDISGSLSIECERILTNNLKQIQCETLENTPQCNGWPEGCTDSQWLAGFHAYAIENSTNSVLLDPVCCSSPHVRVDSYSCAIERLNEAKRPFEHRLMANDLVYRGMQCWHQYNSMNTIVDLVWKMEVCQFRFLRVGSDDRIDKTFSAVTKDNVSENLPSERHASPSVSMSTTLTFSSISSAPEFASSCPPCNCHCGIDVCGNGAEPIRVVHKAVHPQKCSCDCACKYECV